MKQISRHLHEVLFNIRLTEKGRSVLNVGSTMPWATAPSPELQHNLMNYSIIP